MFNSVADHLWERTTYSGPRDGRLTWRGVVGNKACGLISLPEQWTPPFVVIATSLYREWLKASQSVRPSLLLPPATALDHYISARPGWSDRGLVIRSSAVRESMSSRGAYQSLEVPADFDVNTIVRAVDLIYNTFAETGADDEIAVIAQSRIHVTGRGHLSNERRISKTINQWMWEIEAPYDADGRFNSQRSIGPDTQQPLECDNESRPALLKALRMIARWCTKLNEGRTHLEWGLAGRALWLFQIDFEDEQVDEGVDPNALLRANDGLPSDTPLSSARIHVADFSSKTGWPKIDKVEQFLEGRPTPYPKLFYLTGEELQTALKDRRNLEEDIRAAVGDRAVCRTDCIATGIDHLNLPRTDSVSSQAALDFMINTLAMLRRQGANPTEICFIFHKFIPASAAAWALAKPEQQIVLVDALWGLPDGLQYLPHDTFEFDIKRDGISAEQIRYKPKFLQETEIGEWQLLNVARNVARHRSLPIRDLREIATQTHRIANRLNKPIQIMWFCVVAESAGIGRNVPWFMMEPEETQTSGDEPIAPGKKRIPIRSLQDLNKAREQRTGRFILLLEPESDLFRSSEFLDQVVSVSFEKKFPVSMTGSILGHAYYTLERRGVSVITDAARRSRVRHRQVFRKLVRDEIPAKIVEHGERANLARIAKHESRTALVIKLFEEAQELLGATSPKEVAAELADLLEVIRALALATGADWDEVQIVSEEKRHARGSFERNVVLMETSWPRWIEQSKPKHAQGIIPLKDLGEVIHDDGARQFNFAAVIAKGAKNVVELSPGIWVSVSMVPGGVRVERVKMLEQSDTYQQEFEFVSPKDNDRAD